MTRWLLLFALCIPQFLFSQSIQPTSAEVRLQGFEKRKALQQNSLVKNVPFENIGPTIFSGRIVDIDVNPDDPTHFYAAYASGGLWYTESNGTVLEPVFDHEAVMTIGDIAVDWERDVVWVGTGENNSSRSSYSGTGIYRSEDGGKSWTHKGLPESHHISRIILHPTDPNTVWVAVLGHLYSPNDERGIYKTTDGGNNWKKTLFVDDNSGAVDLVIDPQNPNNLYAATWHRERRAWDFNEGGEGSGIHKSTDGGDSWTSITTGNGFPTGNLVGRIGLDIYNDGKNEVLYAIVDNYNRRPKEDTEEESDDLLKNDFKDMNQQSFLELDDKRLETFLRDYRFPKKHSAKSVKALVKSGKLRPIAFVEYLEDANSLLFDTPVIAAEIYTSTNGGKSWKKKNKDYIDFLYNSYGYYFGQVRVAPQDANRIYVLGVPILKSEDGGETFMPINGDNVHSDHHSLWVNPNRDGHLINGNDGGINISYDDGENWLKMNAPSVGQFYSVSVDMAKPYNVYGGLQDNGVWMGSHNYRAGTRWHSSGRYPFKSIMGGDGMQVAIDTRDNETVYTGYQYGNYSRVNTRTGDRKSITPKHNLGDRPYRWNWESPIWLSVHNQDIFYMGSNKLHRSFDQGDTFEEISDDLTKGSKKGDVAFATLTSLHESPLKFGLIYTGSDDGLIHVTKDGGNSWKKISDQLPADRWVASVQASAHDEATVYAALNGYRWDEFDSYCYKSTDHGNTWTRIGINLPAEPVNVLKEDPVNANIVYVGTDHGAYVSLDGGKTFASFSEGLPAVPVHDLVIHPRENHLILGTHGRSFYKADVKPLQAFDEDMDALVVFEIDNIRPSSRWGNKFANWGEANEPETTIVVFAQNAGNAELQIHTSKEELLFSKNVELEKGYNYIEYDLTIDGQKKSTLKSYANADLKKDAEPINVEERDNGKYYLLAGEYTVLIKKGNEQAEQKLTLKSR